MRDNSKANIQNGRPVFRLKSGPYRLKQPGDLNFNSFKKLSENGLPDGVKPSVTLYITSTNLLTKSL